MPALVNPFILGVPSQALAAFAGAALGTAPPISSTYGCMVNVTAGNVLFTKAADTVMGSNVIASLVKLMLISLAAKYCATTLGSETYTVPAAAIGLGGDSATLQLGDVVNVIDLMYGAIVPSGVDAATTLAYYIGDKRFAQTGSGASGKTRCLQEMTTESALIGMTSTTWGNVDGLNGGSNFSTVRDICRLLYHAMGNPVMQAYMTSQGLPSLATICLTQSRTYNVIRSSSSTPITNTAAIEMLDPAIANVPYNYMVGIKGGTNTTPTSYASAILWQTPNGDLLASCIAEAISHYDRPLDATAYLFEACSQFPTLTGTDVDANASSNVFLVGAETGFIDEITTGTPHIISQTSVTRTTSSPIVGTTSLSFNGTTSHMETPSASDLLLGSSDFTVDIFFRGGGVEPATSSVLVGKWDITGGGQRSWGILYSTTLQDVFADLSTTGSNLVNANAPTFSGTVATFWNGAIRHVRMIRSGSSVWIYSNGLRGIAGSIGPTTLFANTAVPLTVGARSSGGSFDLFVKFVADEIRVTKGVARSTAQRFLVLPTTFARS